MNPVYSTPARRIDGDVTEGRGCQCEPLGVLVVASTTVAYEEATEAVEGANPG